MSLRPACTAIAGLALSACSGPSVPLHEFPDRLEAASCAQLARCGYMPDVESCRASTFVDVDAGLLDLVAAVDRGTVGYDGDRAAECLSGMTDAGCSFADAAPPAACDEVFTGLVADGGDCWIDGECASGHCTPASGCTDACCPGSCRITLPPATPIPIGEDCSLGICVDEAYCPRDQVPPLCTARAAADGSCTDPNGCQSGLYCAIDPDSGTGTCRTPPQEGEACDPAAAVCARLDDYCDPLTSTCRVKEPVGGDCAGGRRCVDYAWCDPDGICAVYPGPGQACDTAAPQPCLGALACAAGVCAAPAPGDPCP